ncbi:hypothetical protein HID58_077373 [Brassica napus]|uniref:Fungal lipase-like domain-containing protein n=1 Tax=Brassica napus TaxID=3708 RepID=A0ABQ7YQ88_BRANA|nr:hypothetical protein HID58_077373 [Brassica napus]
MQRDKAMKREALANPWYESFGFSLLETLINPDDSSIYGAVYMYKHYDSYQKTPLLGKPPLYVIAFRGTMLSSVTWKSDMKQNVRCLLNILNQGKRANNAKRAIENVLSYPNVDTESVWLAGHSLGAGIALKELLDSEKLKRKVRIARSFIKTTFASLFNLQIQEDDPRTRAWTPYLYVNPRDPICLGYINDFILKSESGPARISVRSRVFGRRRTPSSPAGEPIQFLSSADMTHRNKMFKIGTETIERIATRNSLRSLLSGEGGGSSCSNSSSEPLHLLPSAYMTIKTSQSPDFKRAHGILCSMVNMFCTSLIIEFHFCSFKCLKKPTPIFELN